MSDSSSTPDALPILDTEPAPQEDRPIRMEVRVEDQAEQETVFKIKSNTRLGKVANAFCDKMGMDPHTVRFLFDGSRIQENDTPESLEMQDGDLIEAMVEQIGGSGEEGDHAGEESPRRSIEEDEERAVEEPRVVKLKLKHDNVKELEFRVRRTVKLKKVMDAWYKQVDAKPGTLRFLFDGHRLQDDDTADSREIDDGDVIQVVLEQQGGAGDGSEGAEGPDSPGNAEPPKPEVKPAVLSVKLKDQNENEIFFNIKYTTKFGKVFDAYYSKQAITPGSLRFFLDGTRIIEHQTPTDLEMEDGDCVDVFLFQQGGGGSNDGDFPEDNPDNADAKPEQPKNPKGDQITLKVKDQDGNETFFKVRTLTKLEKVITVYHSQRQAEPGTYRLMFDGSRISPGDTPESLEMEDGDEIEVRVEQLGGLDIPLLEYQRIRYAEDEEVESAKEHEDSEIDEREIAPYVHEPAALSLDRQCLRIIVVEHNLRTPIIGFNVQLRMVTNLSRVFNACATHKGVPLEELHFTFRGTPVLGNDTPQSLGMTDGDRIDIVPHQDSMDQSVVVPQTQVLLEPTRPERIDVLVRSPENDILYGRIRPDTQIRVLMKTWRQLKEEIPDAMRFYYDGVRI